MRVLPLAVALLVGAVMGFIAGASLKPTASGPLEDLSMRPGSSPGDRVDVNDGPLADPRPRSVAKDNEPPSRVPLQADATARQTAGRFSAALLAHHAEQFQIGWKSVREDTPSSEEEAQAERNFRDATLRRSHALGVRAAEVRTQSEQLAVALEAHDTAGLLQAIDNDRWAPTFEFVAGDKLDSFTRSRGGSGATDGAGFIDDRDAKLGEGMTISFGPGVHRLAERRFRGDGDGIPRDVTIIGAGRDATLLRIGNISGRGDVERLTFRGLTLDAENDGLFDLRTGTASLHMERTRVIRFDAGHGGCEIFSVGGGCILTADESEFIGGYGRSPGNGELLNDGPALCRFKRCRFQCIDLDGIDSLGDSAVRFEGCVFALHTADPRAWNPQCLQFAGCAYERLPGERPRQPIPLTDLFPGAK